LTDAVDGGQQQITAGEGHEGPGRVFPAGPTDRSALLRATARSGESYCDVVPKKQPNKSDPSPAEVVEERSQTKQNTRQPNLGRTPSREIRPSGLERVRETARKNGKLKFTALLHHVSIDLLRESYYSLKKQAAPGVHGMTWEEHGPDVEARLAGLHGRIHRGAYRAQQSRRVWIRRRLALDVSYSISHLDTTANLWVEEPADITTVVSVPGYISEAFPNRSVTFHAVSIMSRVSYK
jgi:hypothetical protein